MTTFVALLRGVNVGKAKRVPMGKLRDLLAGLGYTGVTTLLNSGNVVFRAEKGTAAKHAAGIAAAISSEFKIEVPVIVKTATEIAAIIAENPIKAPAEEYSRLLVAFTQDGKALKNLAVIEPLVAPPEQFFVGKHAAYLFFPGGILKSKAGDALLGKAGKSATTRNWATVLKLQVLLVNQRSDFAEAGD